MFLNSFYYTVFFLYDKICIGLLRLLFLHSGQTDDFELRFILILDFFTKETLTHRHQDILRMKREKRFRVSDFIKTYKDFFPGAEVGTYRWAGYVLWRKSE